LVSKDKKRLIDIFFVRTIILMRITYDDAKRVLTLEERGLDFARAAEVFADFHLTRLDDRSQLPRPKGRSL
jgi:uncharacterized DUF497 family protein